jgi:hypothetical protein
MIRANVALRELAEGQPEALLDTERLRTAGMTWRTSCPSSGQSCPRPGCGKR